MMCSLKSENGLPKPQLVKAARSQRKIAYVHSIPLEWLNPSLDLVYVVQ